MEPSKDDLLLATLESLRPAPAREFMERLDERAAAGFPRRPGSATSPLGELVRRARAMRPMQLALAGGATALAAIAIATVFVAANGGPSHSTLHSELAGTEQSGEAAESAALEPSDASPARPPHAGAAAGNSSPAGAGGGGGANIPQYETELPTRESGASAAAGGAAESGIESTSEAPSKSHSGTGPYAAGATHREVERAAEMVLRTEPAEVGEAAGRVLEAVHQFDGIVLFSSVRGGSEGDAGARFDLLIPGTRLSDALAAFSGIAEVRSRHEASNDITAPTNTVGEGLQDSHARIDGLLNQLADSETEAEREAVEAQLRAERRHAATLKAQLSNLQRRANLSRVSLRIETSASNMPSSGGSWGVGDAFHDAGKILAVAAGIAVVGLAILAPLAVIALLAWLGNRAWVRQRRERALG